MLLLLLTSTFALVCSDVSHLQHQNQAEHDSAPPAKPYAFTYTAGRYPGHADRQHTEVSDGSGVIRGQYSYIDPRQKIRTVQYVADKQGFHPILNDAPPDHPRNTEAVEQANNRHYNLYNTIAEEHQQHPHPYNDVEDDMGSGSGHHTGTVATGAVVEEGAYVYPGATVLGGAVIRRGAVVYDGAVVRGGAVVGPDSRVGSDAVVWDGAVMGAGAILYSGAQIKDGTVLGNGAIVYDGALVKNGAVLGNEAVVGRHAVVGAAAVMGNTAMLRDGSHLGDGQVMANGEVR